MHAEIREPRSGESSEQNEPFVRLGRPPDISVAC